jgi:hypothetical protein
MQGLTPYERERAARIAANKEMMRRLGLPELGSALRLPSTPSGSGGAGIDEASGAHRRAAATIDPDTKLENLDSKYDNNLDARNRAIRSVVRTRSLPASYLRFLERRQRRRRTAVRVSIATTRAPDAFIFFARRRRCGTGTPRNGSKRARCIGARSKRSGS